LKKKNVNTRAFTKTKMTALSWMNRAGYAPYDSFFGYGTEPLCTGGGIGPSTLEQMRADIDALKAFRFDLQPKLDKMEADHVTFRGTLAGLESWKGDIDIWQAKVNTDLYGPNGLTGHT
jgi:hypothetical protein